MKYRDKAHFIEAFKEGLAKAKKEEPLKPEIGITVPENKVKEAVRDQESKAPKAKEGYVPKDATWNTSNPHTKVAAERNAIEGKATSSASTIKPKKDISSTPEQLAAYKKKKEVNKSDLVKSLFDAGHRESALRLQNWGEMDANAKALAKSKMPPKKPYGDDEDKFDYNKDGKLDAHEKDHKNIVPVTKEALEEMGIEDTRKKKKEDIKKEDLAVEKKEDTFDRQRDTGKHSKRKQRENHRGSNWHLADGIKAKVKEPWKKEDLDAAEEVGVKTPTGRTDNPKSFRSKWFRD